ncbi:hypothetical protein AS032_27225 [Rhodococcus qingshengii]|nr:hypothetical protein AOT96_32035 [Rhodococcus sp. 008]KSU70630.1 hypothetical protein AS032_27225 [Rhodococcus qingshengii]
MSASLNSTSTNIGPESDTNWGDVAGTLELRDRRRRPDASDVNQPHQICGVLLPGNIRAHKG